MNDQNLGTVRQRLNEIMREVPGVPKKRHAQHGNYNYAGHDDLTEVLRGKYVQYRIIRRYETTKAELNGGHLLLWVDVIWEDVDNPDDRVVAPSFALAPSTNKQGTPAGQQAGIALSYAIKNAELKVLALKGDATPDPESMEPLDESELDDFVAAFENCKTREEVRKVKEKVAANKNKLGNKAAAIRAACAAAQKRTKEQP